MEVSNLQLLVEEQNEKIMALTFEKDWLSEDNIDLQEKIVEIQQKYNKKLKEIEQLHQENIKLVEENKIIKEQLRFGISLGREMYKEGQYYKKEYIKLCHYVQQCWQDSFKEHTNESPLSPPEGTFLRSIEEPSPPALSNVQSRMTGEQILLNAGETIRLPPTFCMAAPMMEVFPGVFGVFGMAGTNIVAIGHQQTTRQNAQDVVPGVPSALHNAEPTTTTACLPPTGLDEERNENPTSDGLPSSFADETEEVTKKSKKVRNIRNVQNYIKTESIRKSSNINLSWTKIEYQDNLNPIALFSTLFKS